MRELRAKSGVVNPRWWASCWQAVEKAGIH